MLIIFYILFLKCQTPKFSNNNIYFIAKHNMGKKYNMVYSKIKNNFFF